jgi:hypothetical protein
MSDALTIAFPLDGDGFLRRECPTCEREFKWLPTDEEGTPPQDGGYFCPYCRIQAPLDTWNTRAQVVIVEATVKRELVQPGLEKALKNLERHSKGFIRTQTPARESPPPDPMTEVDDMRLVTFTCHPNEPVKVLDEWDGSAACLICGQLSG